MALKDFILKHYNYYNYKRGRVQPSTKHQEDMVKKYGTLYYKDGWPDFRRAAKGSVKIDFTGIIKPNDKYNRLRVQNEAAREFVKNKKNKKMLAKYFNKPESEITYYDVHEWKDDKLNQGKPNHCPLTPHETLDGLYVLYVPKEVHDVGWGGFYHYGGIAVVSEIIEELKNPGLL